MRAGRPLPRCVLLLAGAVALVAACGGDGAGHTGADPAGRVRVHYIAADEVAWDYAPSGRNLVTGRAFGDAENTYVARGPDRIGRVYRQTLLRAYTDPPFATPPPRPAAWEHLGLLGPVIHAEVGDTIRVVFRNHTTLPASMHPHGVF